MYGVKTCHDVIVCITNAHVLDACVIGVVFVVVVVVMTVVSHFNLFGHVFETHHDVFNGLLEGPQIL